MLPRLLLIALLTFGLVGCSALKLADSIIYCVVNDHDINKRCT
jgi:hypothetical protein